MTKEFKFKGKKYNVISEITDSKEWQEKTTDVTREKEFFAFRPWWVGNKFRWLKKVKIEERLSFVRYSTFDDGWSYTYSWKPWEKDWNATKIIN